MSNKPKRTPHELKEREYWRAMEATERALRKFIKLMNHRNAAERTFILEKRTVVISEMRDE